MNNLALMMMERKNRTPPEELINGCTEREAHIRLGRWAIMESLQLGFTEEAMLKISRGEIKDHTFIGAIRKTWNGIYGSGGLDRADIELEAVMLGVYDEVLGDNLQS